MSLAGKDYQQMTNVVTGRQRLSDDDKSCHWQAKIISRWQMLSLAGRINVIHFDRFRKQFDTISIEMPISKGLQVEISIK